MQTLSFSNSNICLLYRVKQTSYHFISITFISVCVQTHPGFPDFILCLETAIMKNLPVQCLWSFEVQYFFYWFEFIYFHKHHHHHPSYQKVLWMQKISLLHLVILLPAGVNSRNWKEYSVPYPEKFKNSYWRWILQKHS